MSRRHVMQSSPGESKEFDARQFLDLLGDSLRQRSLGREARTGVLSARIHFRDGEVWAVSVQFDDTKEKAA
jgi:hypothetical protein